MVTALILVIPEADPLVSKWRALYDPSAREGVPPHVTVLFPFKPHDEIDTVCTSELAAIFAREPAFDIAFRSLDRFSDTVFLVPEPAGPVKRLIAALGAGFPDYPPYGGIHAEVVPHLTVAQGTERVLEDVAGELRRAMTAPIRSRVEFCALYSSDGADWREKTRFPLGA